MNIFLSKIICQLPLYLFYYKYPNISSSVCYLFVVYLTELLFVSSRTALQCRMTSDDEFKTCTEMRSWCNSRFYAGVYLKELRESQHWFIR